MPDESLTPLADALQNLASDVTGTASVGIVADDRDGLTVAGAVSTTLGKGWSLNGQGQWTHRTGWSIAATARWTKGK